MPPCCSSSPRKKFPPPITTAICTPPATRSTICRATALTTPGSTPTPPPPNISPPSLSSTLRYPGTISRPAFIGGSGLADLKASEASDSYTCLVDNGLDGLLGVLHRRLLQQHGVLEEAVEAAFDDSRQRLFRLALLAGG